MRKYKAGTKFVIEIDEYYDEAVPGVGGRYGIKGATNFMTGELLDKLPRICGGELLETPFEPMKRYRSRQELINEPDDMTEGEKRRLENIRAIPLEVQSLCEKRISELDVDIERLESERDALIDFLNGERDDIEQ